MVAGRIPNWRPTSRVRGLPVRSPRDSRAFLHEEKFDTWLDLTDCKVARDYAQTVPEWKTTMYTRMSEPAIPITVETSCELHGAGVPPATVGAAVITPTLPALVLQRIINEGSSHCHLPSSKFRQLTAIVQRAAAQSLGIQLGHYLKHTSESYTETAWDCIYLWETKVTQIPSSVMKAWAAAEDMLACLEIHRSLYEYSTNRNVYQRTQRRIANIKRRYDNGNIIALPSIGGKMYIAKDLSVLHFNGAHYLLSRPLLLEVVNKAVELFCAMLYSHCLAGTSMPENHLEHFILFQQIIGFEVTKWSPRDGTVFNMARANKGFSFLKTVEGLGVAVIIHREDGPKGWINDTLLNNLWSALYMDDIVEQEYFQDSDFGRLMEILKTEQIAEFLGTVKLCGHPSIEFEKGLDKLYERTHNMIHVDHEAVQNSCGVVKRDLLINFHKRHKRYPDVHVDDPHLHPSLKNILLNHIPPHHRVFTSARQHLSAQDWNSIKFMKNADFDPVDNQIVLLKDKALGITRSKVLKLLMTGPKSWTNRNKDQIIERRALLQFLLSPELSSEFTQYLQDFASGDGLDESVLEYLVIKLTAKELEEKPEGRMFGSSPMVERNRRIVMEMNVMNMMDLYEPDQLLTPDELSIIRKMYSFRHFGGMYPDHTLMQVSFDFSKWNNNMRSASIDVPAGAVLDPWFGVHLYCKTMMAYENALVYYTDQHRTRYWEGQLGGIEGLNQATWSLFFLGGIKHMLEERGLIYQVTVKGDDVRAAIAVPNSQLKDQHSIESMKNNILNDLSLLCQRMGWELNPHECFVSLSVIATSKQYQVNNTWLPASTKKAMKMASLSNLVFPTLEDVVSSIFSTAHSTCAQATAVIPAYTAATILASLEIVRALPELQKDTNSIAAALLWPQVLGGPGSLPLQTFFIRGENDMLSVSVSLLRYVINSGDEALKPKVESILSQEITENPDGKLLLSDPYAISLEIPERPASVLKRLLREALQKWTKNPHILQLLQESTQEDEEAFIEHLLSMQPYCAKVATTLWECSPFYIIEEILSRFMQSSTIFSFFALGTGKRIKLVEAHQKLTKVLRAATRRLSYWTSILSGSEIHDDETYLGTPRHLWYDNMVCATQLVHMIRDASWRTVLSGPIHGITYPSIVDQTMLFQPADMRARHPLWDIPNIVTNIHCDPRVIIPQTTTTDSHHYASSGTKIPWLGAVTSSKLELPSVSPDIRSPTISKVLRLINLKRSGHFIGMGFVRTADAVIKSLTTVDLSELTVLSPESGGGHIPHRVAINAFSMTTMPNFRPNLLQIANVAKDQGSIFTGDTRNRTINFAAQYYHGIILATWPLQSYRMIPPSFPRVHCLVFHNDRSEDARTGQYQPCEWCCHNVDDVIVDFQKPHCPDLTHYNQIPLVGASTCDNNLLRASCVKALTGRVHRQVGRMQLEPTNPLAVNAAAVIVINKLAKESCAVAQSATARGFQRIPTGHMVEIMGVTMGIKNIKTVSINLIRAIPARDLYTSVLREYVQWYFRVITDEYSDDMEVKLNMIMPHLNTLHYLFSELAAAGQFMRIVTGCAEAGLTKLDATAVAHTDSDMFFRSFAVAHSNLMHQAVCGTIIVPYTRLSLQCEDAAGIHLFLQDYYLRLRKLTFKRCISLGKGRNIFDTLYRHMKERFDDDWDHLCLTLSTLHTVDELFDDIDLDRDADTFEKLDAIIDLEWASFSEVCEALHQMFYLVYFPYMLSFNENCLDIAEDLEAIVIREVVAIMINYTEVDYPEWTDVIYANDAALAWCINSDYRRNQYQAWFKIMVYWSRGLTQAKFDMTDTFRTYIRNTVMNFSHMDIIRMVGEDADRILRLAGVDTEGLTDIARQRRLFKEQIRLAKAAAEEACLREAGNADIEYMCPLCDVDGLLLNLRREGVHTGAYVSESDALWQRWPEGPFSTLLDWNLDRSDDLVWLEPSEFTRCIGYHNTSAAKYAEVLVSSGALAACQQNRFHQLVICLADGLGGVSALLQRAIPRCLVLYNSLYLDPLTNETKVDANPSHPPMEVMAYSTDPEWLNRCVFKGLFPGDLCIPEVQDLIVAMAESTAHQVSLITCDADIPWKDDMQTAINVINATLRVYLMCKSPVCYVIIKTFAVKHQRFNHWIWNIGGLFPHMHIQRCRATRPNSTEVFLIIPPSLTPFPDHMLTRLTQMYQQTHGYSGSMTRMTWLNHQMERVGNAIAQYRVTRNNNNLDITSIFNTFTLCNARPLSLSAALLSLYCYLPYNGGHLCNLLRDLRTILDRAANEQLEKVDGMTRAGDQPGFIHPIRSSTGHTLAFGDKAIIFGLRRVVKCLLVAQLLSYTSTHGGLPSITQYWECIETVYSTVIAIKAQSWQ
ncbi:polymerase [Hancheng leafhopper mivirus]|uniref:polymerase n=1 Tax=Hancheng leafhopper mivirus TaxID=2714894 RepID=UPI0024820C3E|nr:polymerase [Hancheng leafhopper mivirus]QIH31161.1 polymerase [Hancheng leafhopper mivirus]